MQLLAQTDHVTQSAIWLKVNGVMKQNANLNQMLWSVAEPISKLSEAFERVVGDIICLEQGLYRYERRQQRRDIHPR